jgi:hypothetical protein
MAKRKICKKENKTDAQLSELFYKYLQEYPEMNQILKTYNMNTEQYLCFLSEILLLKKTRSTSKHLTHFNIVSTNSSKAVPAT